MLFLHGFWRIYCNFAHTYKKGNIIYNNEESCVIKGDTIEVVTKPWLTNDLNMNKIEELALAMIDYNYGDPKRI